jgi:sugar phosphate isomerase/epimerase
MSGTEVRFPDGRLVTLGSREPEASGTRERGPLPRLCFAAAHVVMTPGYARLGHGPDRPGAPEVIAEHVDWDATLEVRRRIGSHGFGIAEAMDTAQRFEIGWPAARRLIESCGGLGLPGGFVAGAGCDQLTDHDAGRSARIDAIVEQVGIIQAAGGDAVLLPQAWLCAHADSPQDWVAFYRDIVRQVQGPLVIHWLGEMFHPGMRGAFPGPSFRQIMGLDPSKIRACKLSLLDARFEVETREALRADGQLVLTGDDFHFGDLMIGDGTGLASETVPFGARDVGIGAFSHALLGVLDAVAAPVRLALRDLAAGDVATCRARMNACEEFGRIAFEAPTSDYKTGLALCSWLNGWQDVFLMPNGAERARSLDHVRRLVAAADRAGVLTNPGMAAERLVQLIASRGD